MKEILKFLRQLNNYSQDQIASLIGVSRQSYSKYENGSVTPSEQTVNRLAETYKVPASYFYYKDFSPVTELLMASLKKQAEEKNGVSFQMNEDANAVRVAEPAVSFKPESGEENEQNSWDVYYDGNTLRLADNLKAHFSKGQKFKLVEFDENSQKKERDEALETLLKYAGTFKVPENFDYKEELYQALVEKYGPID